MKILVTGTAGFIGYHLIKRLVEDRENEIVGLDNINNYYDVSLKYARLEDSGIEKERIKDLLLVKSKKQSNYSFVKLDLVDKENLNKLFNEFKPDIVVNLAAQAGVRYSLKNPNSYIQSNIVGFVNLLECCRHWPIQHLVYASSSSVYGNDSKAPFSEQAKTDSPVSLYAATKKANELLACSYSHLYRLPTTGLRFFTVYGPWGRPDMAPILFADAIMNGRTIKVFNNGDMERDFTYIDDIVGGIIRVTEKTPDATPPHKVYNIGCSKPVKLMDFIRMMEDAIGKKARMEMQPMQPGDVYRTYADTKELEKDFGYCPAIELEEGIKRFAEWYKNR